MARHSIIQFFDSLGLGYGSLFIAVLSAVVACVTARFSSPGFRWAVAVVTPFVLAYCCYWMPVWLGRRPDEDWSWAPIGIGFLSFFGILASLIVTFIISRHAKRNA
jgi:hypothetical protein